jgi:hypothetical protein
MQKKNSLAEEKAFSEIINKIQVLKDSEPNENWVISNRAKLAFRMEMERKKGLLDRDIFTLKELFSSLQANAPRRAFKAVYAFSVLGAIILTGGTLTAFGAVKSLPGSPLYPVKIKIERVALMISSNKAQVQNEMTSRRLEELKTVIASQDSAINKKENVETVVANLQQQLLTDKQQFSDKNIATNQETAALSVKEASQRANQVKKAIAEAKESLPVDIKANLSEKLAEVSAIADKTNLQVLAAMISKEEKTENDIKEITEKFNEIIADKEAVIKNIAKTEQEALVADKLPINSIRAVLINQAEEGNTLLLRIKKDLSEGNLTEALETLKALNEIVSGAEKIAENVSIQLEIESTGNQSTATSSASEAVPAVK